MELSIFLAKTWGLFTIIFCSALLLRYKEFKAILKKFDNEFLVLYGGILALGIGVPQILAHNIWVSDWRIIVTILGWAVFFKGVFLLFFPKATKKFAKIISESSVYQFVLILYLLIGVYLLYKGFYPY